MPIHHKEIFDVIKLPEKDRKMCHQRLYSYLLLLKLSTSSHLSVQGNDIPWTTASSAIQNLISSAKWGYIHKQKEKSKSNFQEFCSIMIWHSKILLNSQQVKKQAISKTKKHGASVLYSSFLMWSLISSLPGRDKKQDKLIK